MGQRATYVAIFEQVNALSKEQQDTALWNGLDLKEAAIFHKYITAAGNQIEAGDECKSDRSQSLVQLVLTNLYSFHRDKGDDCTLAARQAAHQHDGKVRQRSSLQGHSGAAQRALKQKMTFCAIQIIFISIISTVLAGSH